MMLTQNLWSLFCLS